MTADYSRPTLSIIGIMACIALQGCGGGGPASDPFAPNPAGTLMPDGSRWGPWDPEKIEFVGGDDLFETKSVEILASGFRWTEGPTWVPDTSELLFSDTIDARLYRWREGAGVEILSTQSGGYDGDNVQNFSQWFEPGSNGIALVGEHLYINQHPTHRVVRTRLSALSSGTAFHENEFEVLTDKTPGGRRLNSPNDVVVASNGDVYFTDPIYGFLIKQPEGLGYAYLNAEKGLHPDQPYLDDLSEAVGAGIKGVYRIRGSVTELVTSELERPNGLALSNDESILWVANSDKDTPSWTAFPLSDSLPLENITVLDPATLGDESLRPSDTQPGLSDGFKIDEQGRIWSSMPGGLVVIDPEERRVLAKVRFGINLSNIGFGTNGDVFITGIGHVWRLRRKVVSVSMMVF